VIWRASGVPRRLCRAAVAAESDVGAFGKSGDRPGATTLTEVQRARLRRSRERAFIGVAALALSLLAGLAWADLGPGHFKVSQRGRAFLPGDLVINRGDIVQIVNDDGDLLHHAYVESDRFNFDSGDQEPGSKVDIAFTASGNFTVLCGIHPKMKLLVHVN
jgi:plastocyanin